MIGLISKDSISKEQINFKSFILSFIMIVVTSKAAYTYDCRNIPTSYLRNDIAMQTSAYLTKQHNYELYQPHNATESYGRAYEGLTSAILNGVHICVIEALIYEFEPIYIDINASNYYGTFPLVAAIQSGRLDIVRLLLSMPEVDVNITDHVLKSTALMEASYSGNITVINILLDTPGINVNAQNYYGMTALMYAVQSAYVGVVKELLRDRYIDVFLENLQGETALQMAEKLINTSIFGRVPTSYNYYKIDRYREIAELLRDAEYSVR